VDEPSEEVASLDRTTAAHHVRPTPRIDRRGQAQSAVGPLPVVVLDVDPEHPLEVPMPEDEHPIKALCPDCSDPSLGEGVGLGSSDGSADHPGPVGVEDLIEARDVLRVPIPDEEAEWHPIAGVIEGQVPRLLGDPRRVRMSGSLPPGALAWSRAR
jgi:hypothetical protein